MCSEEVIKYGLIGKTLGHSFSKSFFNEKFDSSKITAIYENIELEDEEALKKWMNDHLFEYKGLNVTIPYKETVLPLLDELSDEVKAVGAVNTILINNGKTIGYNTDVYGFRQAIKPFFRNVHERALILGTGGASKAVAYVLKNLGVSVSYLSRNPKNDNEFHYNQANEVMVNAFKMIVNCTPVGMFPDVEQTPDFPIDLVGEDHLVIDLIYNPQETIFLKQAREHGADILNGLSMLQHQAIKAWEIWNA
ncbi:MAG: shikimate dehydrogenase [Brumimicrobium sp.]|nr:shikimate dehydrogenase [Brumimicrobium sp.]MCO5268522.1 shikimate dehydrogenase [Brumimicrobium sp.]